MASEQQLFERFIQLLNKTIEVGLKNSKVLKGKVTNAMFDSFLLDAGGKTEIVPFTEVLFVTEK